MDQEKIALGIVLITVMAWSVRFYRVHLVAPLSEWVLKRGKVKLAMGLRKQALEKSGCSSCKA